MSVILSYPTKRGRAYHYGPTRREMLMDHLYFRGEYVEYGIHTPMRVEKEAPDGAVDGPSNEGEPVRG